MTESLIHHRHQIRTVPRAMAPATATRWRAQTGRRSAPCSAPLPCTILAVAAIFLFYQFPSFYGHEKQKLRLPGRCCCCIWGGGRGQENVCYTGDELMAFRLIASNRFINRCLHTEPHRKCIGRQIPLSIRLNSIIITGFFDLFRLPSTLHLSISVVVVVGYYWGLGVVISPLQSHTHTHTHTRRR